MQRIIEALKSFVHSANFGGLHPLDEERFYKFIIVSYIEDQKLDKDLFVEIIKEKAPALSDEEYREYYSRYERGLDFARVLKTGSMFK